VYCMMRPCQVARRCRALFVIIPTIRRECELAGFSLFPYSQRTPLLVLGFATVCRTIQYIPLFVMVQLYRLGAC
jgi:hypothetical protein